jgi:hypothetical protein
MPKMSNCRCAFHSRSLSALIKKGKNSLNITHISFSIIVIYLTECLAKTRKVGGSLVVTLPKELVEAKKIKEGEIIQINVKKIRKDGFGILKGVGPFTVEDELTTHD